MRIILHVVFSFRFVPKKGTALTAVAHQRTDCVSEKQIIAAMPKDARTLQKQGYLDAVFFVFSRSCKDFFIILSNFNAETVLTFDRMYVIICAQAGTFCR